jgi:hypothetical protein
MKAFFEHLVRDARICITSTFAFCGQVGNEGSSGFERELPEFTAFSAGRPNLRHIDLCILWTCRQRGFFEH